MSYTNDIVVKTEFERALEEVLSRVFLSGKAPHAMAVAYSGGLDSTVLLHLAQAYAKAHAIHLFAFHIHHGLQKDADSWLAHCEKESRCLDVQFDAKKVMVDRRSRDGVEAAARRSRYAALGELCRVHQVPLLLTAHHLDDQVETVLLQLMRGSGVAGLSGMDSVSDATGLLGNDALLLARPLLFLSRRVLADWLNDRGHAHVEDQSNRDVRFARNAVRHEVIPVLTQFSPSAPKNIARTAQHVQFAQRILDEVAEQDWVMHKVGNALNTACFTALSQDRVDNLLRYWLGMHGARMPSTAWLEQARQQLMFSKQDAQINITLDDFRIRRYRNCISIELKRPEAGLKKGMPVLSWVWNGEEEKRMDDWEGTFLFQEANEGVDADWLRLQHVQVRPYLGTERFKRVTNRPSHRLKAHYQELGIPAWERRLLPLLYTEAGSLFFAAGIGLSSEYRQAKAGKCIRIEWLPDGKNEVKL